MRKYTASIFSMFLLLLVGSPLTSAQEYLPDLALQPVTKTHTEMIRESPHSWDIQIESETPVVNESISIEVLEGVSRNPSIRSSATPDFSSLQTIVRDVTTPDMNDEQKAVALWRFTMNNIYNGRWGTSADGLEHLNVYGYGYCGTFVAVLEPLWWAAGLRARHINTGNHAATEVYYDNDWHYLDAQMRWIFLERDNRTIASLDDLYHDPELWDMQRRRGSSPKGRDYYYKTMHPKGHGRSPVYSREFAIAKDGDMELNWQKNGKWCLARGDEGGKQPATEPPIYANGVFRSSWDFGDPTTYKEDLVSSENIDWQDRRKGYLHPDRAKEDAFIIYRIKSPYFIPEVAVTGKFLKKTSVDFIEIDLSTDNGKQWHPLWKADKIGILSAAASSQRTQEVTTRVPWKYSYLIKIRMRAASSPEDVGAYLMETVSDLSLNPRSLPALRTGENKITFRDEATSTRTAKVTYSWQEDLSIRISKEEPMEGEKVELTAIVGNRGKREARNVPVFFYHGNPYQQGVEIGKDTIKQIGSDQNAVAKIEWKATRALPHNVKMKQTPGARITIIIDPDNSIQESDELNNTYARSINVLNPPSIRIPHTSFIRLMDKPERPEEINVTATIGNYIYSRNYGIYLGDQSEATEVVVKFFDGHPGKNNQIGSDQTIDRLLPIEFKSVSVNWNVKKLQGLHKVYVQAFPGRNVTQSLGFNKPSISFSAINLDAYHKNKAKN